MTAPRQILMLRHGQSAANVDQTIYDRVPDYRIPLTDVGLAQAEAAGESIRQRLDGEKVCVRSRRICAPTRPWPHSISATACNGSWRSRGCGNRTGRTSRTRRRSRRKKSSGTPMGIFFYRFREGESGSDVYDRVSSFLDTLYRHWSAPDYPPNTLLVTHGLTMRLFCMRWFHWSVEYFVSLNNPENAEVRALVRNNGHFALEPPFQQWSQVDPGQTVLDRPGRPLA